MERAGDHDTPDDRNVDELAGLIERNIDLDRMAARHEASHAVCGYLIAGSAPCLTLETPRGTLGGAMFCVSEAEISADDDLRRQHIDIALAGPADDAAHPGDTPGPDCSDGDWVRAWELVRPLLGDVRLASAYLGARLAAVSALLGSPSSRRAISALADRLETKRRLSNAETREVIAGAIREGR